ncbi:ATP-binding protein [Aeromicrobium sp. Leaf350]|uniref:sensor histidine kinase n=1 Tax=Aeromicrobium sp. Leaf350 TaxID=2876565 RepID=UPI001E4B70C9|nr:ATP-binding protein [Aeromicrobium sp. Leaf350]
MRRTRLTLAGQVLVLQLVVMTVVLVVVAMISVRQSTTTFQEERGSAMRSVAEYIANVSVVRDQVDEIGATRALAPTVDRGLQLSGATTVAIARIDGTVVASSDPSEVGSRTELGDSRIAEGRGWSGDLEVDGNRVVAAHAPVIADDGTLLGFTIATQEYPRLWDRLTDDATDLALFLGIGALAGGLGTWWVSRVLKRRTRGLGSAEIATLADHREALLHSIGEGVVAVDTDGRVTLLNDGARALLGLRGDVVGRRVASLDLPADVRTLLGDHDDAHDEVVVVGDRVLVANRRAARSQGRGIGSVTSMRDRTELVSLRNQLSSNLSISDTLRAQTHEFANRLHTISGLVELEEYDELAQLLGSLTRETADLDASIRDHVADPAVAALLVAKSSAASEVAVRLVLDDASTLPELDRDLSADLTTVIGNLVDNAIDACRGHDPAEVVVRIARAGADVEVVVTDTGPGVAPQLRDSIFVRGFSTKPEVLGGRGIGLPLVRLIATRRGGTVELTDPAEGGARFVFTVPLLTSTPGQVLA